jgi:hypothetical protein
MPRLIMTLNEGEPHEVGGLRVTARLIRARGRRIRVVVDLPPKEPEKSGSIGSESTDKPERSAQ